MINIMGIVGLIAISLVGIAFLSLLINFIYVFNKMVDDLIYHADNSVVLASPEDKEKHTN